MSFSGGGSDLKAFYQTGYGAVVSTTINKYVYVIVNKKFDDYIRVSYSQTELVYDIEKIQHNIIREALKLVGGINKGIDIVYMADVQPYDWGTGLGSSSSIAVGVLNALYAYKGVQVSPEMLAEQACKIEIELLDQPIGKQDQYAAAFGGLNYFRFNADDNVIAEPIHLDDKSRRYLNQNLLLFNTNMNSDSKAVLSEQKANTLTKEETRNKLIRMVGYAEQLRSELKQNNLDNIGNTLHQGWLAKRELASKISNDAINDYYERAIKAGAIGGKLLGSGGGGFLLFYCKPENHENVRKALADLKELQVELSSHGSEIIYNSRHF